MTILPHLGACKIREVWARNFEAEFARLLAVVFGAMDGNIVIAVDTEFPGCVYEMPQHATPAVQHQTLCRNVDVLRPIQIGIAVATGGVHRGVWNFNLKFDLATDRYAEDSISFLSQVGIDFSRHASEGLDPWLFGRRLAESTLFGKAGHGPLLITFSGQYDLAYLVKILTGKSPPQDQDSFKEALADICSGHRDVREYLPYGSLQSLLEEHNVCRCGTAHTAGSDAIATLELFARVAPDLCTTDPKKTTVEDKSCLWRKAARSAMLGANANTQMTIERSGFPLGTSSDTRLIQTLPADKHGAALSMNAGRGERGDGEACASVADKVVDEWIAIVAQLAGSPQFQNSLLPQGLPPGALQVAASETC